MKMHFFMLEFSTLTHLVTVLEMPTGDKEAATFYKRLTDMIAWKRQNPYAHFRCSKTGGSPIIDY